MPTTNAEKSVLNSILNFVGGKSLTHERVDPLFYITLFIICSKIRSLSAVPERAR